MVTISNKICKVANLSKLTLVWSCTTHGQIQQQGHTCSLRIVESHSEKRRKLPTEVGIDAACSSIRYMKISHHKISHLSKDLSVFKGAKIFRPLNLVQKGVPCKCTSIHLYDTWKY